MTCNCYVHLYFRVTIAVFLIHHVYDLVHLPDIDKYDFSKLDIGNKHNR